MRFRRARLTGPKRLQVHPDVKPGQVNCTSVGKIPRQLLRSIMLKFMETRMIPYDCTQSGYPGISSIALEKEHRVAVSPRPPLPITPPIWAQVRQIICLKEWPINGLLVSTGSVRVPRLLQELSRWRLSFQ
jgi:hypothetical protein